MPINLDRSTRETLAELASIFKQSPETTSTHSTITSKLEQLGRQCLTAGCEHGLKYAKTCKGYFTNGSTLKIEGGMLSSTPLPLRPLVQPFFCEAFTKLEDSSKSPCRDCSKKDYCFRDNFDGVFCHGCGLFIDFAKREIGYIEEWTTRVNLEPNSPLNSESCKNCGSAKITAKFGDYAFCSKLCLQDWYFRTAQPSQYLLGA